MIINKITKRDVIFGMVGIVIGMAINYAPIQFKDKILPIGGVWIILTEAIWYISNKHNEDIDEMNSAILMIKILGVYVSACVILSPGRLIIFPFDEKIYECLKFFLSAIVVGCSVPILKCMTNKNNLKSQWLLSFVVFSIIGLGLFIFINCYVGETGTFYEYLELLMSIVSSIIVSYTLYVLQYYTVHNLKK